MPPDVNPPARAARVHRNDERIIDAARQVLGADPRASMADIGAYAGVGMSALYRRYPSKQALIASLVAGTLTAYRTELTRATQARAGDGDLPDGVGNAMPHGPPIHVHPQTIASVTARSHGAAFGDRVSPSRVSAETPIIGSPDTQEMMRDGMLCCHGLPRRGRNTRILTNRQDEFFSRRQLCA